MKKILVTALVLFVFACKDAPKNEITTDASKPMEQQTVKKNYPENLVNVFEAHGGLEKWKTFKTLSFDIENPDFNETHVTDLYKRIDKIATPTHSLGYDGAEVWLLDTAGTFEGDPLFYHNLMFYFYAMPFVLADGGIHYEEVEALKVDGVSYPGYKISYDSGIGASSKDEYYLHYDAETFKMKWLGYTVTYFSKEDSDKISWINYGDWENVDGLILPKAITWHTVENGNIKGPSKTVNFVHTSLSKVAKSTAFYAKPENATVIE